MGTKTSPPHITVYQQLIQEEKTQEPQITIHDIHCLIALILLIGHDDLHTIQDITFHSSLLK
jgi:hypothetical protein